ncbi:MAG: hypothetical protein Q8O64_08225 [Sideroxyarcus sp.]|nr:hypothetical protein [Sideroxyarcus sp.]
MFDLLGDALPVARKNDRPEAAALVEVLQAVSAHPAVAVRIKRNTSRWC